MSNAPQASPSIENLFIGKGIIYMKEVGDPDSAYTEVGNSPKFEFTPKPEVKKHYSSQAGTKVLDDVVVVSKEAELSIDLEEITPDNLLVALMGALNSDGSIELLGAPSVYRAVKLVGTNDVGVQYEVELLNVFFECNKAIGLIDDNWGQIPLTGMCLRLGNPVTGSFGTMRVIS
jgi:hypothetical protein